MADLLEPCEAVPSSLRRWHSCSYQPDVTALEALNG